LKPISRTESALIHIIDSLSMGGAEIILHHTIQLFPQYKHVIVYLKETPDVKVSFDRNREILFCLNHSGWKDLPSSVRKLKRIIKQVNPCIIHSHLIVSTLIARLATPVHVPLVTSLHSELSTDAFAKNRLSVWIERLTLKKRHALVAVSNHVLQDYLKYVPHQGKHFVLYNFLPEIFFSAHQKPASGTVFRCVAVGNLKEAKNYEYLLDIFSHLKNRRIQLDIYGGGYLEPVLQRRITTDHLPVELKGKVIDPRTFLNGYDLFIQASSHEGFGLSVIEAMAMRLPVLLSDIAVFREITGNHAHFFPLNDAPVSAAIITSLAGNNQLCSRHADAAFSLCRERYNQDNYKNHLSHIYQSVGADC
jgi:glycosyltransferase involved in cell wall biosynthesis